MTFPPGADDLRRDPKTVKGESGRSWLVLWDEDYGDLMIDGEDNLYLLVDDEQAAEVERLAQQARDGGDNGGSKQ